MTSGFKTVFSQDVFQAPANFSHARVLDNGLVYASAQIPLDTNGKIVGTTIEEQTEQVLKNHEAILVAAGSSLKNILRINVYLVEPSDYSGFSDFANASSFVKMIPDSKPPRGCVFVKALPAGAKVEMDLVALVGP
ncbi:putative endoribonuclease L-PSP [Fusarium tricinctum]|uniref:Endoribonuclease L-PSP n=1 Tax=Fusarium tricinctum TaxID=61284 RepID=A0A8K0RN76_9HYPO|nr:putative endoribonuclease L-PSP [Fusarium tricinctum]